MSSAADAKPQPAEGQNPILGLLSPDGDCVVWDQDVLKAKPTAFVFSPTAPQLTVNSTSECHADRTAQMCSTRQPLAYECATAMLSQHSVHMSAKLRDISDMSESVERTSPVPSKHA